MPSGGLAEPLSGMREFCPLLDLVQFVLLDPVGWIRDDRVEAFFRDALQPLEAVRSHDEGAPTVSKR
jgi:hypothetical protein